MNRYPRYSMRLEWSEEDDAFIVTVPELPGCVTHGGSYEEALRQGRDAMESWIDSARAHNEPVPAPRAYGSVA